MFKSIQSKIILVYVVTVIAFCLGLSYYVNYQIGLVNSNTIGIEQLNTNLHYAIYVCATAFGISLIAILVILSKIVIVPMNRLIKSAEKISGSDKEKLNKLRNIKKVPVNKQNKIQDIFTVVTDELNNKLKEVQTQKNQIETILLHMTDGLIAFSKEGEVILINPAAKNLLDISPEDENFSDIFGKFSEEINMEKIMYLDNWTSTNKLIEVNNNYLNTYFAPFKDEENRPGGVIVVIQNITEHIKLNEMRKEFVADVSHELKTPLTTIMGYSETLLADSYEKEIQTKFLNMILTEARRMAKLVTDLLTLSKYETNNQDTTKELFDIGKLVKKSTEKLNLEAKKKNQKVDCYVTADVPPVYGSKDDIERVYLNILSNAIKYTPENGEIKIYVGYVNNHAYIKVFDNGIGIPKESLDKIFERFYRVDKSRSRQMGGTGLGLAIAKEILDKNAGSIDIKSEVAKGTEVIVKIPTKEEKFENTKYYENIEEF